MIRRRVLFFIALLCSGTVCSQSGPTGAPGRGSILIESAELRAQFANGKPGAPAFLDVTADIVLPDAIRDGLDSGVPLEFLVELDIREPHRLWFHRSMLQQSWRYTLNYFELTRHYRLQSGIEPAARNFRSLFSALEALATLRDLPLSPGSAWPGPAEMPTLEAAVSIRLDTRALPLPLQPLVSSTWRLASPEYAWALY